MRMRRISGSIIYKCFRFLILFGLIFLIIYPFLFMFVTAFRGSEDLNEPGVIWITRHYTFNNFAEFIRLVEFKEMMLNTFSISLIVAVLQTLVASLTGYGFARFRFRGRNFLFGMLLFTIIVPPQTYIAQTFVKFLYFKPLIIGPTFNTVNTLLPFILPAMF